MLLPGHQRRILLFVAAVFVPALLLAALGLRLLIQERELEEKRLAGEQRRTVSELRQELLARLERSKLQALSSLAPADNQASVKQAALVFVSWVEENRLLLLWESQRAAEASNPVSIRLIQQGEQAELAEKRPAESLVWFSDGLFKIDSETGETTLLAPEKPGSELGQPRLSHDGKAIFYQNKNTLWKRNLETGEVKEIYRPTPPTERIGFTQSIALSPDDERLAFLPRQSLFVISANGGMPENY